HRIQFAERSAEMVHYFLGRVGLGATPERQRTIHPQLMLELGGILQIAQWESSGLRAMILVDLPDATSSFIDLCGRLKQTPAEYLQGNSGTDLWRRVMDAWSICLVPSAPLTLGADMAAIGAFPTSAMELLADF